MCLKKKKIKQGFYNAGFENLSIIKIANIISKLTGAKINIFKNTNDPRSYRLDSSKLIKTGFIPKSCVKEAILELTDLYYQNRLKVSDKNYTVQWMKKNYS